MAVCREFLRELAQPMPADSLSTMLYADDLRRLADLAKPGAMLVDTTTSTVTTLPPAASN